ncbi:hypothetical protein C7M84_005333 [Penaeus vannamei]|uniref:Uncharacterized protein n=1 Tax=Penaeus vannamei TaxID=6689 RepID=A0A3R7QS07_PENVA|nr:hypothetical protein C7M84_005333 [Penaeus vannamei]
MRPVNSRATEPSIDSHRPEVTSATIGDRFLRQSPTKPSFAFANKVIACEATTWLPAGGSISYYNPSIPCHEKDGTLPPSLPPSGPSNSPSSSLPPLPKSPSSSLHLLPPALSSSPGLGLPPTAPPLSPPSPSPPKIHPLQPLSFPPHRPSPLPSPSTIPSPSFSPSSLTVPCCPLSLASPPPLLSHLPLPLFPPSQQPLRPSAIFFPVLAPLPFVFSFVSLLTAPSHSSFLLPTSFQALPCHQPLPSPLPILPPPAPLLPLPSPSHPILSSSLPSRQPVSSCLFFFVLFFPSFISSLALSPFPFSGHFPTSLLFHSAPSPLFAITLLLLPPPPPSPLSLFSYQALNKGVSSITFLYLCLIFPSFLTLYLSLAFPRTRVR